MREYIQVIEKVTIELIRFWQEELNYESKQLLRQQQ